MIPVTCGECGTAMNIPNKHAGKKGRCKNCNAIIIVPDGKDTGEIPDIDELLEEDRTAREKSDFDAMLESVPDKPTAKNPTIKKPKTVTPSLPTGTLPNRNQHDDYADMKPKQYSKPPEKVCWGAYQYLFVFSCVFPVLIPFAALMVVASAHREEVSSWKAASGVACAVLLPGILWALLYFGAGCLLSRSISRTFNKVNTEMEYGRYRR